MVHVSKGRTATSGTKEFGKGLVTLCKQHKELQKDAVNGDKQRCS